VERFDTPPPRLRPLRGTAGPAPNRPRPRVEWPAMRVGRNGVVAAAAIAWLGSLLVLDVGAGMWRQRLVGLATIAVLAALLRGERRVVRAQVLAVVAVATAVEYAASPGLGLYTYRLENVPLFVPPGHGLVYLGALAMARSAVAARHRRRLVGGCMVVAGAWAAWGVLLAGRGDAFGALCFLGLLAFAVRGPQPLVYVAVFAVTTYLELAGTALGTWAWSLHDPLGVLTVGNPPSGIAAGYCVLDVAGATAAPRTLAWIGALRDAPGRRAPRARLRSVPAAAE
jgi:hypothetical protein